RSLFCSMTPPPPRSTLFPYTTLFRSGGELPYDALVLALGAHAHPAWPHVPTFRGPPDVDVVRELVDEVDAARVDSVAFVVPAGVDRKSTRLNSSHDQISYAVFCLKKK